MYLKTTMKYCFIFCILILSGVNYVQLECLPSYHKCDVKGLFTCIPSEWLCDYNKDCDDGSDEAFCPKIACRLDQFTCKNVDKCIEKSQFCDGKIDCIDHSDEKNCTNLPIQAACDIVNEYDCMNNKKLECVSLKNVCDRKVNCSNGRNIKEDCTKDMCQKVDDKHRCSHICINKYSSFVCDCPIGMRLNDDKLTCTKKDICLDDPTICPNDCTLTSQGHTCSCYEGYNRTGGDCHKTRTGTTPLLLYSSYSGIYGLPLFGGVNYHLLPRSGELTTFDAKYSGNDLEIYSRQTNDVILLDIVAKYTYTDYIIPTKIVSKSFSFPTSFYSIAVDPVRNLVFWANFLNSTISVFNTSSMDRSDIITTDCFNPHSLILDPISARIFWIDAGIDQTGSPRIIMANMDGSGQIVLVKSGLRKPTSLVLDTENQHLYWNDIFPGSIQFLVLQSALKGLSDTKVLFESHDFYPYSMAIFRNRIYWSDWHQKRIYYVHKISGKGLVTVAEQVHASIIKIISPWDIAKLRAQVNDPNLGNVCSGISNPCNSSCLPTGMKLQAKCFGSPHQTKGRSLYLLFLLAPAMLLLFGMLFIFKYRSQTTKNLSITSNTYRGVAVTDEVRFCENANEDTNYESHEVDISDSIPIIQTV